MTLTLDLAWFLYPLLALLVYWPCLNGQPIFDDQDILPKITVKDLSWQRIVIDRIQRPLTTVSYILQSLWPNTMRGLHVGNVLIHAANGMVVEAIGRRLGMDAVLSCLAGLLFIVHPFAVNTTAYVAGRAALLSCFFGFLAVLSVMSHPVSTAYGLSVMSWAWLAIPLMLCSLLSKPDGAGFLPLVMVLAVLKQEWAVLAVLSFGGGYLAWKSRLQLRDYLVHTGDAVMRQIGLPVSLPQPEHCLTVIVETINRLPFWFIGVGRSPYHGSGIGVPKAFRFLQALFIALFLGFLLTFYPVPVLLILLGPWLVYGLAPVPDQLMEYRNYSATAGFALLLASLLSGIDGFLWTAAAWIGAVVLFSFISVYSAQEWKDPISFWLAATFRTSGDPSRAFGEVGAYYKLKGDDKSAEPYLREAVRINPRFAPALNNLAWVRHSAGDLKEAIALLTQCTETCPQYALGWHDLGMMYEEQGSGELAQAAYKKALTLEPKMERSVNRMGILAFYKQQFEEALIWFHRALTLNPNHFEYVYNRAVAWKHSGHAEEAQKEFSKLPQPCPITREMIRVEFAK